MFDSFASVDVTFCINAQGGRAASMCNIITEAFQEFMLVNTAYVLLLSQVRKSAQHQNGRRGGRPDQFLHLAPCLAAVRAGRFGQLGYFAPRGRSHKRGKHAVKCSFVHKIVLLTTLGQLSFCTPEYRKKA